MRHHKSQVILHLCDFEKKIDGPKLHLPIASLHNAIARDVNVSVGVSVYWCFASYHHLRPYPDGAPACDKAPGGTVMWCPLHALETRPQVSGTMTRYPTHTHYLDGDQTSPFPILLMPTIRLSSDMYAKSLVWPSRGPNPRPPHGKPANTFINLTNSDGNCDIVANQSPTCNLLLGEQSLTGG